MLTGQRDLNATFGLREGIKLAKVAAEAYAAEHAKAAGAEPPVSPENPTRKSNIFLAIQPTIHDGADDADKVVTFAVHLYDPEHGIALATQSQALPLQWLLWLDAAPPADTRPGEWALPEPIRQIMDAGGVDPREWVVEWVEEAVGLAVGVVAQKYVAKRMRVGEAGEVGEAMRQAAEERDGAASEEARVLGM